MVDWIAGVGGPEVTVKPFELDTIDAVFSSCEVFPDIFGVAGLEPSFEEFF